jgi:hypothetical protein
MFSYYKRDINFENRKNMDNYVLEIYFPQLIREEKI